MTGAKAQPARTAAPAPARAAAPKAARPAVPKSAVPKSAVPKPASPKPAAGPKPVEPAVALALVPPKRPDTAPAPAMPKEELALVGGALTPSLAITQYLESRGPEGGPVRASLGTLASGLLTVRQTERGLATGPGESFQSVPLRHPLLLPLANAGIEPVLAVRIRDGVAEGHAAAVVKGRLLGGPDGLLGLLASHAELLGWAGLGELRLPAGVNELSGPTLTVTVPEMHFDLGGFLTAAGSFGLAGEAVTFKATAVGTVPGLGTVTVPVERGADGALSGQAVVDVALRGFAGTVTASYAGGVVDVHGLVKYANEKFDGELNLVATDPQHAKELTDAQTGGTAAPDSAGPRPGPRVVAGWGTIHVQLADWLSGETLVVVDHHGDVTVVGKITPRMDKPLFEAKEYVKALPALEVRALYGVPLLGNVFVFANVALSAKAGIGPATLDRMELSGTWSTKPEVLRSLVVTGTLNIPAYAALVLTAKGGAGVQLLGHDVKAGVAISAIAGIRGYVEATPRLGYREIADPRAGKRGEFFIGGHMELAAQPFLGLAGELFVEVVSPWWSPVGDHRWPWPLLQLEYPLPGEFGIGADVDYVLGSGKAPDITFGEVQFSADKFMGDLLSDRVPTKSGKDDTKTGAWKDGKSPAAAAPKPRPAAAPPRPAALALAPAPARPKAEGSVPKPETQQRWLAGLHALGTLAENSHRHPLDSAEIRESLAGIKKTHGFSVLEAELRSGKWLVTAGMSPKTKKPVPIDADPKATGKDSKAGGGKGYDVEVMVDSSRYPESASHIRDAQSGTIWHGATSAKGTAKSRVLTIARAGAKSNRDASLRGIPTRSLKDRDEYPPAMFAEGGAGASVKYIASSDNRGSGSVMGHALTDWDNGKKARITVS